MIDRDNLVLHDLDSFFGGARIENSVFGCRENN